MAAPPADSQPHNPDGQRTLSEREMIERGEIDPQAFEGNLPPELQDVKDRLEGQMQTMHRNLRDVNILVTGLTGSGKSALVNALTGSGDAAQEGAGVNRGCTLQVVGQTSDLQQQINIRVWDTPGLKDGTREDKKYLSEILCIWNRYRHKDLVIFCIEARPRYVLG